MATNILAWDAVTKEYHAKPGETNAPFFFSMTNMSSGPVVIYDTSTSCDCTVASLPSKPWTVQSGGGGKIQASIDLIGKIGIVTNDQATDLVDTNSLRAQGFDVGEVPGACFCCNFNKLTETVGQLEKSARPDIVLAEPGTEIALELFGRWAAGVPFRKDADARHEPGADLTILVLKGQVTLKHDGREFAMQAPPGPAMIEWDSVAGLDEAPEHLDKLPAWAVPGA